MPYPDDFTDETERIAAEKAQYLGAATETITSLRPEEQAPQVTRIWMANLRRMNARHRMELAELRFRQVTEELAHRERRGRSTSRT